MVCAVPLQLLGHVDLVTCYQISELIGYPPGIMIGVTRMSLARCTCALASLALWIMRPMIHAVGVLELIDDVFANRIIIVGHGPDWG